MKLLLVGQAPGRKPAPGGHSALVGSRSLANLARYAGLQDPADFEDFTTFTNVVDARPEPYAPNPKWDAFDKTLAEPEKVFSFARDPEITHVVVLGAAASEVFVDSVFPPGFPWFSWVGGPGPADWTRSPHPAGTSMWWNDPGNRRAGSEFWSGLCETMRSQDARS